METRVSLLVWGVCILLSQSAAQDCSYAFVMQPPLELSCDPYNTSLQLQCTLSAPSQAVVLFNWFSGNSGVTGGVKTSLGSGVSLQPKSSIISTGTIDPSDEGRCFWCEAELAGLRPAVVAQSNVLCVSEQSFYSGLSTCFEDPSNLTRVCVNLPATSEHIITSSQLPQSSQTTPLPPSQSVGTITVNSLPPQSNTLSPSNKPSPSLSPSPTPLGGGNTAMGSDRNLDGLYAAVAVCIAFLLVIVVLVTLIMVLCRNRFWKRTISYSPRAYEAKATATAVATDTSTLSDLLQRNAFTGPLDSEHSLETVVLSAHLDTGSTPPGSATSRTKRLGDLEHDYSDIDEIVGGTAQQRLPEGRIAPDAAGIAKLREEFEASSGSQPRVKAGEYDHLDPLYDQPPDSPDYSKPTEQFYYTLESSEEEREKEGEGEGEGEERDEGERDYEELYKPGTLSAEIFDDPKYAMLFVNTRKGRRLEGREMKHWSLGASPAILGRESRQPEDSCQGSVSTSDLHLSQEEMQRLTAKSMPELTVSDVDVSND